MEPATPSPAARPSLTSLIPKEGPPLSSDQILDRFVTYVSDQGLSLYPAQEEAILALLEGKHLVLGTPTGSGKSLVAFALHFKAMAEGKRSFYTCPIKALVNEKFFALCDMLGAENVGMVTGDASINKDAPVIVCTAEILANLCLRESEPRADYVVMDEFHYYADKERGVSWQIPLLVLEHTTFLLMSATLGDTTELEARIENVTGREVASVKSMERPVPLDFEYVETPLHETLAKLVEKDRAPVYLVNFTQRAAAEEAQNLMSVNFTSKEGKEIIRQALFGFRFDTPYGKEFQRFIRHGVGLHHAGLLPKYRLLVERLAQGGLLKVVSGTDTLGVGVNIPIRTVLFTQLCKYDGEKTSILPVRDFRQIAGRAGRKGFDDRGTVVVQAPEHVIENLKLEGKKAAGKKIVKKQPPQKGYVHWDLATYERLLTKSPEQLEPRFEVNHGLILNLLQGHADDTRLRRRGGYGRLVDLVMRAHVSNDYARKKLLKTARTYFRSLLDAQIVDLIKGKPAYIAVSPDLQDDFSLHYTLSLYLLDALGQLERDRETYAYDVLTMVESIVENPTVILGNQLHKLKGDKLNELKAQGMEYDERMAELEKLEYPKPNRDFIYGTFNQFAAKHPWVGQENIRPKSIAREMFERFLSFHDYVREYGLERMEGLLLRYLSEVYKGLLRAVPEQARDEQLEEMIVQMRLMLRQVDSSLLDEWERMKSGALRLGVAVEESVQLGQPRAEWEDPRSFARRVRTEAQRLLKALADRNYEDALLFVRQDHEGEWTAEKFDAAMAPYWSEHGNLDITPRARKPEHTVIQEEGKRRWTIQQKMLSPSTESDWILELEVDVTVPPEDPDLPLIRLRRIGT